MKWIDRRVILAALLGLLPARAFAKVVFTGYGDLRYNSGLNLKITGSPATLAALGTSETKSTSRAFSANAIGLFATTEMRENLQFSMDVTFRNIGATVGQLVLQYAYLNWTPMPGTTVLGGKVTLPFGYYNENRFYPFQRYNITPPIFISGILGLPMADWGGVAKHSLALSPFNLEASAFMVNGYGNVGANKTTLRSASLPGGLSLANSIRPADNNHKPALGGRVRAKDIAGAEAEVGASYYWETWDTSGLNPLYLAGAHAHANFGGLDVLAEGLHMAARGDSGFAATLGNANWTTDGGFGIVSYDRLKIQGKTVAPFAQAEIYRTRPNDGGVDREVLRTLAGGAALRAAENVLLKAEFLHFVYELPDVSRAGWVRLDANGVLLSAVLTF